MYDDDSLIRELMDEVQMITRTRHHAWLSVAGGDEQCGKLSHKALAVHFQSIFDQRGQCVVCL